MRMRGLLGVVGVVLVVASCTEKNEAAKAPATPVLIGPPPPPSAPVAPAPPAAPKLGAIDAMEMLADNTLAIASAGIVITIDAGGAVRRATLPPGGMAKVDLMAHGSAIVVEAGTVVKLLKSPTLEELWSGEGQPLEHPHAAVASGGAPTAAVRFVQNGALAQVDVPVSGTQKVLSVHVTESKKFAVVTFADDGVGPQPAQAFDLTAKKVTTTVEPMMSQYQPSTAMFVGDTQLSIVKGNAVEIDLATGRRRQQKVCSQLSFGNPLLSPGGDLALFTCGNDGIAIDPKTLGVKRRFVKIMPGCDNGDWLPAFFDKKTKGDLVVEGCGGHARLDTATAKYRCSDGPEIVGAPYPGMASPNERLRPGIPPERLHLPRCSTEGSGFKAFVSDSRVFYLEGVDEENPELMGPNTRIKLEAGVGNIVLAADESRFAYELPDRVVVRDLPAGKVLAEMKR